MRTTFLQLPRAARCLLPLLALLCMAGAGHGARDPLTLDLWRDPVFQKELVGSFGIKSDIEPGLTTDEQIVYDRLAPLIGEKPDEAIRYLEEMVKREDGSAMFNFTLGNLYFLKERKREAAAQFDIALEKLPTFFRAHKNLAAIYAQASRPEQAIAHFTEVIRLGGGDGTVYGLLGSSYVQIEQFVPAEAAFRQALLLSPEVKDWSLGLVRALFGQEKFKEAAALTGELIKRQPDQATYWLLQASAHLGAGETLRAASDYEVLRLLGEADGEIMSTLGNIYVNEGLLDLAAETYLEAFRQQDSPALDALLKAAEILLARDGLAEARRLLAEAGKAMAENAPAAERTQLLRLEARVAIAEGTLDEAKTKLTRVVELEPLDGDSLILLAQQWALGGEPEKAIFLYERAANLEKHDADARVRHAQLLVQQGKYEDAIPLLKRAQDINPRESVSKFAEELERHVKGRR